MYGTLKLIHRNFGYALRYKIQKNCKKKEEKAMDFLLERKEYVLRNRMEIVEIGNIY